MLQNNVLAAIAQTVMVRQTALGLAGVSYPAIDHVPQSPWLMVRQSQAQPTVIVKARAGLQVVSLSVDLVALVVSDASRPGDAARLDGLIEPLLDLFDANAYGGNVNSALPNLSESVDRVWQQATVRRFALEWGESGYCHAAIITMDTLYQRKALLP